MPTFLEFEKPIAELEGKIEELRHLQDDGGINIADEVARLQAKAERLLRQTYAKLDVLAEDPGRAPSRPAPSSLDYVEGLIDGFHAARRRPGVRRRRRHRRRPWAASAAAPSW